MFEWNSRALTYDVQTLTQILYSLSLYDLLQVPVHFEQLLNWTHNTQWFVIVFSYIVCGSYCLKRMQVWVKMVCGFCICIYTSL